MGSILCQQDQKLQEEPGLHVVVQSLSRVRLFATTKSAHQPSLSFTFSQCLLKLMSSELMTPSNHLVLYRPLLLFSNEVAFHIRWPKYWSFSLSISPSDGYSGLISFKIDCCWSSPAPQSESIHSSALNLLYGPTLTFIHDYWKTIALTRWTFVGKVMSLLFNTLSVFVIVFVPRSKCF